MRRVCAGRGRGGQAARLDAGGRGGGGNSAGGAVVAGREPAAASFLSQNGAPLTDEYDPARPNDYAAIRRKREAARKEVEREAERQEAMRRAEQALQAARPDEARDSNDAQVSGMGDMRDVSDGAGPGSGLGAAAPLAAASGEEAYQRRARRVSGSFLPLSCHGTSHAARWNMSARCRQGGSGAAH